MQVKEQAAEKINLPIEPEPNKEYFLKECQSDLEKFRNIEFFLDYLDTQIELLPQMIYNDPEDKEIDRTLRGMEFISEEMRLFLDGNIDRALGSLGDYVRGKRVWE